MIEAGGRERPLLTLVFPAYDEIDNVPGMLAFVREIRDAFPECDFEMLVVDDGSADGTAAELNRLATAEDRLRIVRLSRNFGSHAAISAGYAFARGDAALTLSADRQEPLSAVGEFIREWRDGADIVWGLRSIRAAKKGMYDRFATGFSRVYQATSDVPTYPQEGPSQILVSRAVMDVLNAMPELNRNVLAMAAWTGFDQRRIYFEQLPRPHGVSKWTSRKKRKLVIDSFVEFSHAPLQWLAGLGVVFGGLGAVLVIVSIVQAFTPAAPSAFVPLLAGLVLGTGGVVLGALSVLGEYVWRTGDDARRRPLYIVRDVRDLG